MKILAIGTASLLLVAMLSGCSDDKAVSESDKADPVVSTTEQASEQAKQIVDKAAQKSGEAVEKAAEMTDQVVEKGTEMAGQVTEKVTAAVQEVTAKVAEIQEADLDGESLYKGGCSVCHDMGVAGAPKLGDQAAWSARIAQGKEALYSSAINGKGVMPAKGGNLTLSDAEVKAVVDYMVSKAQ